MGTQNGSVSDNGPSAVAKTRQSDPGPGGPHDPAVRALVPHHVSGGDGVAASQVASDLSGAKHHRRVMRKGARRRPFRNRC
jgi:hypothetical protein